VQQRRGRRAAGQDEAGQVRQLGVPGVARLLEPLRVGGGDAQRGELRVGDDRRAQVGADVEQVVLDARQQVGDLRRRPAQGQGDADRAVGLVDVGVGHQTRIGLGHPAHVAEVRLAGVPGLGVDARQPDHGGEPKAAPA
jgi:hypothetical protein